MTPAERTAKIAELRAEADRLEREGKRNWPEKVERGDLFQEEDGSVYMWGGAGAPNLLCVKPGVGGDDFGWYRDKKHFLREKDQKTYLGHARNLLTIKTPDEDPTGADLVGRVCEFSHDGTMWVGRDECARFDPADAGMRYMAKKKIGKGCWAMWFRHARLYREDRP